MKARTKEDNPPPWELYNATELYKQSARERMGERASITLGGEFKEFNLNL